MYEIDHYAQTNKLSQYPAGRKLLLGFIALLVAISSSHPLIHLAVLLVMGSLTVVWAGIPLRPYLGFYRLPASFILLSLIGVALSVWIGTSEQNMLWSIQLFSLNIGMNSSSLEQAGLLLGRSLAGISATYFIALTTPVNAWVGVLNRLRVPREFSEMLVLVYRFITIFSEEYRTLQQAAVLKFGYRSPRIWIYTVSAIGAVLFNRIMNSYKDWQNALQIKLFKGDFHL